MQIVAWFTPVIPKGAYMPTTTVGTYAPAVPDLFPLPQGVNCVHKRNGDGMDAECFGIASSSRSGLGRPIQMSG